MFLRIILFSLVALTSLIGCYATPVADLPALNPKDRLGMPWVSKYDYRQRTIRKRGINGKERYNQICKIIQGPNCIPG